MGRKRVADMTPEELERKREGDRQYHRNMTPEQRELKRWHDRKYDRDTTPEHREQKRERAGTPPGIR